METPTPFEKIVKRGSRFDAVNLTFANFGARQSEAATALRLGVHAALGVNHRSKAA
jgi:hypothetical protein